MKKTCLTSALGISLIVGSLFSGSPVQASNLKAQPVQVEETNEVRVQQTYTKYVQVQRSYYRMIDVKGSIAYNSGGYSGTLRIVGDVIQHQGFIVVTYGGNVSCTGNCPI